MERPDDYLTPEQQAEKDAADIAAIKSMTSAFMAFIESMDGWGKDRDLADAHRLASEAGERAKYSVRNRRHA